MAVINGQDTNSFFSTCRIYRREDLSGMLRIPLAIGAVLSLAFFGSPRAQLQPKALLKGEYDCKSGRVRIAQEFENLAAAGVALKNSLSEESVDSVLKILTGVCTDQLSTTSGKGASDLVLRPHQREDAASGHAAQSFLREVRSLLVLRKEGELIKFSLFDLSLLPFDTREKYMASIDPKTPDPKDRCKPISSVCIKCPDGVIYCATPPTERR